MTKFIQLEINSCPQCPYRREDIHKGLPNGVFRCVRIYDRDERNPWQSKYRAIPKTDLGERQPDFPDWCPLPDK